MYKMIILACLLSVFLQAHVEAAGTSQSTSYYTQQKCITELGTVSAKSVSTTTYSTTFVFPFAVIISTTPTQTVTPSIVTSTSTASTTTTLTSTASTMTETFTSVVTPSSTSTVLSTTTVTSSTETITSTTVTPAAQTLTISTAAGFTPIATQIMSLGITDYSRKKRSAIQREDRKARRSVQSRSSVAKVLGLWSRRQSAKAIFPRFVICKKFVEGIIYSTVPSRQTSTVTAKPSTTSVTVTSTFTSTSTVAPLGVKTTTTSTAPIVTVFTTSTITQSTTTTSTSTSTAVAPAPPTQTYYPACQANNVISKIKGINLDNHGSNPGAGVQTDFSTAPSALECCHQCQDLAAISPYRCQFYIWNTANRCVIGRYDAGGSVSKPAHYYIAYSTHPSRSPETAGNGGGGIVDSVDQD